MALLGRVFHREPRGVRDVESSRMSIIEHLEDLRRALIIILVAWGLATVFGFIVWKPVFNFLIHDAGIPKAYYQAPTGAFFLALKVALYVGFGIAIPVIVQQTWWFVSPGLHRHEKRLILPLISATILFFYIGVAFALFSLPLFIRVLTSFAPPDVAFFPFVDEYLSFVLGITIGFGLVFEMPVVLYVLGMVRIISSRWLYKNRIWWYVGLGLLAQFLTPGGDPFTPLIMAVPLLILWEGTALLLKVSGR
jgi:sec-independent protein translocase protein TatC